MGSDNLFHKRKARRSEDNRRKAATRQPYDRVLIVCEGEKTEPIYFEEVRLAHDLDSTNIEIDGSCGSSPLSVVNHAYQLYIEEQRSGDSYNRVFCVFDRDRHDSYADALKKVDEINADLVKKNLHEQVKFEAIISNPAFEYWLLLHYNPTTKPYKPIQGNSVGGQVVRDLKVYIPDYQKNQKGLYKKSIDEGTLDHAIANSQRIYSASNRLNDSDSCTNVHELIIYLRGIKQE